MSKRTVSPGLLVFAVAAVKRVLESAGCENPAPATAINRTKATVQRMQALSDMEGLSVAANDTLGRILELQNKLTAKGHYYYQIDPTNLAAQVAYDPATQHWTKN